MSGDSSSSGNAAGGGIGELEDLEQRLADRMDAALNQRMDVMMQKFSSMLQGASIGGGDRSESGGGGSAATGGNQFVPGAQSGAPGGAEMSSIPGRPPTPVGPRGREGSGGAVRARRRWGGIVCSAEQPPRAASGGGVREGDTAGGESSSRPDVEGVLVRTVEVPAEGGCGGSHNTNSREKVWRRCCAQQHSRRWGHYMGGVTATDKSIQDESCGGGSVAGGNCLLRAYSQGRQAEPGCRASRVAQVQRGRRRGRRRNLKQRSYRR